MNIISFATPVTS